MSRAAHPEPGSICSRDVAGFCRLALWGNAKCFRGPDGDRCEETNFDAAYARLIAAAKRRLRNDLAGDGRHG